MATIPQFFEAHYRERDIPIDIQQEMALMGEESLLEITFPTRMVVDLLQAPQRFSDFLSQVSCVPEFVVITDLVGNRYEIIINQKKEIELPEEGNGRFSIPKAITFIFNAQQVKALNKPILSIQSPQAVISVSHVDEQGQKITDSIRHVKSHPVKSQESREHADLARLVKDIYPFSRLVKDYMKGDRFGLSQERGYNDFALWGHVSSLEPFYDLLIEGLVDHKMSGDFIFNRVDADLSRFRPAFLNEQEKALSIDALLDTTPPILPTYLKNPSKKELQDDTPASSRPRRS